MTREQVKEFIKSHFGIEEPTDEMVTAFLNQYQGDMQKEKDKNKSLLEKANKADELQKQLDEINESKMSEVEKANADLEKALSRIAELESASKLAQQRADAMNKFKVTDAQAKQIVKDDGSIDYDILSQIIADKEEAAAKAKEDEIANGTNNPGGGNNGSPDEKNKDLPKDVENAKRISFASVDKKAQATRDFYK